MASTRRFFRIAAVGGLSAFIVLGCDDNPVAESTDDPQDIVINPGFAVLDAGEGRSIEAFVRSQTGDPTLDPVSFSACDEKITVAADENRVRIEPPDRALITGQTLGESCVVVSGAGQTDTIPVVIEPAALVTEGPDIVRAGATGEVVVTALDANGNEVGPFTREDVTYSSADTGIVRVTDDIGSITTRVAGPGVVTATWTGPGATRTVDHAVLVQPNVPVSAEFDSATFGALQVDSMTTMQALALDEHGNVNTFPDEVLGATVESSDPSVAEASVAFEEDPATDAVQAVVTVTGVSSGTADISGELETSEGTFAYGPADVTVLSPTIAAIVPGSGEVGAQVVINGSGLAASGFDTEVTVGGFSASEFIETSTETQVTLQMPNAGAAGDHDVIVSVGGVPSGAATWTQVGDNESSEPDNDDPASAPVVVLPFNTIGSFQDGDSDDFYAFTVAAPTTIVIDLDWNNDKDLDVIVQPQDEAVVADDSFAAYGNDVCGNAAATADKPEQATCELEPGDYVIHVIDFLSFFDGDESLVSYTVTAEVQ